MLPVTPILASLSRMAICAALSKAALRSIKTDSVTFWSFRSNLMSFSKIVRASVVALLVQNQNCEGRRRLLTSSNHCSLLQIRVGMKRYAHPGLRIYDTNS